METAYRGTNSQPVLATTLTKAAGLGAWFCLGCNARATHVVPTTILRKKGKPRDAHFRVPAGHNPGCRYNTNRNRTRASLRTIPSVFRLPTLISGSSASQTGSGTPGKNSQGVTARTGAAGGAGRTAMTLALVAKHWHMNQPAASICPLSIPKRTASTYGAIFTSLDAPTQPLKQKLFAIYYSKSVTLSSAQTSFTAVFQAMDAHRRVAKAFIPKKFLSARYSQLLIAASNGQPVTLYLYGEFINQGANVIRLDLGTKQSIHVEP